MKNLPGPESQDTEFLTHLYRIFFDREPDPLGFEQHLSALRAGLPPQDLVARFLRSNEFSARGRPQLTKYLPLADLRCTLTLICDRTVVAVDDGRNVSFLLESASPVEIYRIDRFRSLLAGLELPKVQDHGILAAQLGDRAYYDIGSLAFGRLQHASPMIQLIPDTNFFQDGGYSTIRGAALRGKLPRWKDRRKIVFWRGSPTTHYIACDGTRIDCIAKIPRVAMCLALKDTPQADVAIMGPSQLYFVSDENAVSWLLQRGIFRTHVPMVRHADYKFLIDIDGIANSWSFFEKLLLGSCILKVESPFEQWFYREIAPWQHFVPVSHDLSDLIERIDWCLQHEAQAGAIAERGQQFALRHTPEAAREVVADAVSRSIIPAQ